jgi:hypothetical protein
MNSILENICSLDPHINWCYETSSSVRGVALARVTGIILIIALFFIIAYIYTRFIELRLIVLIQETKFKFIGKLQRLRPH